MTTYRISDNNASEIAAERQSAAALIRGWLFYDEHPWTISESDLRNIGDDESLADYADYVGQTVALSAGEENFAGHGSYEVSAMDSIGVRICVEEIEEN